jgi:integrase
VRYCKRSLVSDLKNHRKVFASFLKWCVWSGYLRVAPDISYLPEHVRRPRRIIKPHELELLFKNANGSLLLFLSIALYNGLRRTEIMTLTKERVNLKDRYIVIPKKFNKLVRERSLPINKTVAALLDARIKEHVRLGIKTKWIFPNALSAARHADLSGLKTAWRTTKNKAGLTDITWHDFRATFEKDMNKHNQFTDMQKEKFADASLKVQKDIYVNMDHEDLRGLENSVKLPMLEKIIKAKLPSGKPRGGEL